MSTIIGNATTVSTPTKTKIYLPGFVAGTQNTDNYNIYPGPTLHVASSDPTSSDGADGDFWFVYEE